MRAKGYGSTHSKFSSLRYNTSCLTLSHSLDLHISLDNRRSDDGSKLERAARAKRYGSTHSKFRTVNKRRRGRRIRWHGGRRRLKNLERTGGGGGRVKKWGGTSIPHVFSISIQPATNWTLPIPHVLQTLAAAETKETCGEGGGRTCGGSEAKGRRPRRRHAD
jgi:hypothetical protein